MLSSLCDVTVLHCRGEIYTTGSTTWCRTAQSTLSSCFAQRSAVTVCLGVSSSNDQFLLHRTHISFFRLMSSSWVGIGCYPLPFVFYICYQRTPDVEIVAKKVVLVRRSRIWLMAIRALSSSPLIWCGYSFSQRHDFPMECAEVIYCYMSAT